MYPLKDTELPLHDLVEHWQKHRDDKATASDLHSELLKRFWLGELPLRAPLRPGPWERGELLALLRALPQDEVEQLFAPLSEVIAEPGEFIIELPPRVRLPEDPQRWSDDALEQAYAVMAQRRSGDYTPHSLPGLTAFLVHRDDFAALCDRQGWPRPGFWFRTKWPGQGVQGKSSAEYACRRWLRDNARAGATPPRKKALLEEALRRFPGLTKRGFDRAWNGEAPATWRQSGRRRGT